MTADAASFLRRNGRMAGALYLIVVLTGIFCLAWAPSQLGGSYSDSIKHVALFRAGIAAFLVMQVAFLLLPLALYRVLADVDRPTAVVMVMLAVASVPIGMVAITYRLEALWLLQDMGAGAAQATQAAFVECVRRYGYGLRITSLFWGLWLLPLGWLVLRSARLPRVLGLLLILGGMGYVVKVFGSLVPGFSDSALADYATLPAALGEIGSCLWLLVFGAREGRVGTTRISQP